MLTTCSSGEPSLRRFTLICNEGPDAVDRRSVFTTSISPTTLVQDAAAAYLKSLDLQVSLGRKAPATRRNTAFGLGFLGPLGMVRLGDLRRSEILAWAEDVARTPGQRKDLCRSRDRAAVSALKALLAWCSDRDACPPGLASRVPLNYSPQPGRALSMQQLLALRAALLCAEDGARQMPSQGAGARLLLTLLFSGARIGEVRTAEPGDVDVVAGVLRRATSKTGKPRVIVLGDGVAVLQRQLLCSSETWLFPGLTRGEPLAYSASLALLRRAARRAGIPNPDDLSPHDLRHTFATLAYEAGSSIEEIASALSHASTSTTRKFYLHNAVSPGAVAVQRNLADARARSAA